METDTVSMLQSSAMQEVNPIVLDKSLEQKEEQMLGIDSNAQKVEKVKSDDPDLGQNINLFT